MNIIAVIPARMGSSRYPGKPLALILGMPMLGHVALRTAMAPSLMGTYIATCDQEIMDFAESINIPAIMTSDKHTRCSDRCAEALLKIEKEVNKKIDIVVMVQGDEPLVTPEMIESSLEPLLNDSELNIVNLMGDLNSSEEFEDPNEVKVVVDKFNNALYFSREPIPSKKKGVLSVPMKKQVCIIPFRRDFLLKFNELMEMPLEIIESVDMLRILENGEKVRMVQTNVQTLSVDTPEDREKLEEMMKKDSLCATYLKV